MTPGNAAPPSSPPLYPAFGLGVGHQDQCNECDDSSVMTADDWIIVGSRTAAIIAAVGALIFAIVTLVRAKPGERQWIIWAVFATIANLSSRLLAATLVVIIPRSLRISFSVSSIFISVGFSVLLAAYAWRSNDERLADKNYRGPIGFSRIRDRNVVGAESNEGRDVPEAPGGSV